ncbi:MAG: hypothetical protein AAGA96_17355 [Verrucomicrobiota bacterium]
MYDAENPFLKFDWVRFENSLYAREKDRSYRSLIESKLLASSRAIPWSSDETWGVAIESVTRRSAFNTARFLFRVVLVSPEGQEIEDISPDDLELISNTKDKIVLFKDRWVALMDWEEEQVDLNFCEIADKNWRSQRLSLPVVNEQPNYCEQLHPWERINIACGKWLYLSIHNKALLWNVESNETVRLDRIYSDIVARNLRRIRTELLNQKLPEAEIDSAVQAWEFSIRSVSSFADRIYLFHSAGVSSFDPSGISEGDPDIQHLDLHDQEFKVYKDKKTAWRASDYHTASIEMGDLWVVMIQSWDVSYPQRSRKILLIDRREMKAIGTVFLSISIAPEQLVSVQDSLFIMFRKPQPHTVDSDTSNQKASMGLVRLTLDQLLEATVAPQARNARVQE